MIPPTSTPHIDPPTTKMPRHRDSAWRRARTPLLHVIFTNHHLLLSGQNSTSYQPQEIKSCPQNAIWEEIISLQNFVAAVMEADSVVLSRLAETEKRVVIRDEQVLRDEGKIEELRGWLIWVLDQEEDGGGVALRRESAEEEGKRDAVQSSGGNVGDRNAAATTTVAFPCSRGKLTMTMRQAALPTQQAAPAGSASGGLDLVEMREQMTRGIVNVTALREVLDLLIDDYEMRYL